MKPWFVFYHLTFSFLFVNSFMQMSKLSRITIIFATISLASYFTLESVEGISWQLWASGIVLMHLINWNKNNLSEKKFYEDFELIIWEDYFREFEEEEFDMLIECSKWEKFSRRSQVSFTKDEAVLKWEEIGRWTLYRPNSYLATEEDSLYLFVDIGQLRPLHPALYSKLINLIQSPSFQNKAA